MKYTGNFFSLPNEIFLLGLSPGELAVYCYLRRCENQKTHQCWPSYKTIGGAVGICANTVSRYVKKLEERGLIAVEPTKVTTKAGVTRNGTLQFTVFPPQNVIARLSPSRKNGHEMRRKSGMIWCQSDARFTRRKRTVWLRSVRGKSNPGRNEDAPCCRKSPDMRTHRSVQPHGLGTASGGSVHI